MPTKTILTRALLALGLGSLAMLAAAQVPPAPAVDRQARTWAASCAACHGTDGKAAGAVAPIAGREADALYRTLLEFKNGQRPAATVMQQHTKGYSDAELKRIAQYFASIKP